MARRRCLLLLEVGVHVAPIFRRSLCLLMHSAKLVSLIWKRFPLNGVVGTFVSLSFVLCIVSHGISMVLRPDVLLFPECFASLFEAFAAEAFTGASPFFCWSHYALPCRWGWQMGRKSPNFRNATCVIVALVTDVEAWAFGHQMVSGIWCTASRADKFSEVPRRCHVHITSLVSVRVRYASVSVVAAVFSFVRQSLYCLQYWLCAMPSMLGGSSSCLKASCAIPTLDIPSVVVHERLRELSVLSSSVRLVG